MKLGTGFLRCFLPALLIAGSLPSVRGDISAMSGLLANSPFGGASGTVVKPVSAKTPLEFRAVLNEGNETLFSVFDAATHASVWVHLNEKSNFFKVRVYDARNETLTVDFRDEVLKLILTRAPVTAGGTLAAAQPGVHAVSAIDDQILEAAPLVPKPDPTLVALAEETRRRRALRAAGRN